MKSKTIAESIAELRNRLEEIDSLQSAKILQESNSSNRLLQHMNAIENESMSESVASIGLNALRGMKGGEAAAKGAANAWNAASAGEKAAARWGGRATTAGLIGAGAQGNELYHGKDNALSYLNPFDYGNAHPEWNTSEWKPTDPTTTETPPTKTETPPTKTETPPTKTETPPTAPVTPEKPVDEPKASGGGAKPHHSGLKYDPEVEMLQQYLNSKGANLVVDGLKGPKTQAAIQQYMPRGNGTAPAAPAGQTAPAGQAAGGSDVEEIRKLLSQFQSSMAELQGMTKNDPNAQKELSDLARSVGG